MSRIFQDDPNAIEMLNAKIAKQEIQRAEIKSREHKSYELTNLGACIRTNKKTLAKLIERKEKGITLERATTFVNGSKRFYYKTVTN
tara:strand:- start:346 stop:606 length:261 start_codon:yes stop_codon:yes gene_type:complete